MTPEKILLLLVLIVLAFYAVVFLIEAVKNFKEMFK
jgi:hypothetical protein